MCFVWIWEQTAIISLYSINWPVCITEVSVGRPTHRWEILKCTLRNTIGGGGRALAQDRNRCWAVVNAVTKLRVSCTEYNFSTSWKTSRFSTRATLHEVNDSFIHSFIHSCLGLPSGPSLWHSSARDIIIFARSSCKTELQTVPKSFLSHLLRVLLISLTLSSSLSQHC